MRIGVLGGGQLGRMLALAGIPLGHSFTFVDPAPDACAGEVGDLIVAAYDDEEALGELAARCDVVTYEFENVDVAAAEGLAGDVALWPPPSALAAAQDRVVEKRTFERSGLRVAPYAAVSDADELRAGVDRVGAPCLIKTRREGYDGKGQARVLHPDEAESAWDSLGRAPSIVETLVSFSRELSLIAVRSTTGETVFYPLIENHHSDGILRRSFAPASSLDPGLEERIQTVAEKILDDLGYIGALAIELFEAEGGLLGNEMAPRVHNSGHYSIEGSATSQFENHVRAITGAPLGSTAPTGPAIMVNLIGEVPDEGKLLAVPHAHLHLYGKQPRAGRKLGHVTLAHAEEAILGSALKGLEALVPADAMPTGARSGG